MQRALSEFSLALSKGRKREIHRASPPRHAAEILDSSSWVERISSLHRCGGNCQLLAVSTAASNGWSRVQHVSVYPPGKGPSHSSIGIYTCVRAIRHTHVHAPTLISAPFFPTPLCPSSSCALLFIESRGRERGGLYAGGARAARKRGATLKPILTSERRALLYAPARTPRALCRGILLAAVYVANDLLAAAVVRCERRRAM